MHCLRLTDDDGDLEEKEGKPPTWTWRQLDDSTPMLWSDDPFHLPFDAFNTSSHAVHPMGHTIFVSVTRDGTYSYSTKSRKWTRHGDWELPFRRHGIYNAELDSWSFPPRTGTPPELTVGKEKVFVQVPGWKHVKAELVYMGGSSEYCLVEWLRPEGDDHGDKFVLRLTKLRVVYDDHGEIRATGHRTAGCHKVSKSAKYSLQAAFWM
uniref:Uncharacterized protein n=1 Tax=Leersia perrieri TaxID=77586 RepID=A0A0D9WX06_9ORYZ